MALARLPVAISFGAFLTIANEFGIELRRGRQTRLVPTLHCNSLAIKSQEFDESGVLYAPTPGFDTDH